MKTPKPHEDVCQFRDDLFMLFIRTCDGLPGPVVARALYEVSGEIWDAGIDHAYEGGGRRTELTTATAFDLTWLTAVILHLNRERRKLRLKAVAA